ncbi:MAG: LysM peptidoglycan-binding domain-containing protein, partial [Alkaliphilus sp.]|nr:LysM peptidoglycan-binding domain-containing protein [Alkaliphilus sp.]
MYYYNYSPRTCPSGTMAYTVKAGDTFFTIAGDFGVSLDALIAANPNVNPDRLQIGQVICIPGAVPPPSTCPPGTTAYIIRAGDTFYTIAKSHNVSLDALLAANPGVNPDNLQIGQTICIPGAMPPPTTCPSGTTAYIVRAGDTFYTIAKSHNVSLDALLAANPDVNPDNLQIGQTICIPGAPPPSRCPSGTFEYTVKAGDTFFTLAQRFNTTVAAIQQANPGVDPNRLQIGQIICIPGTPTPPPSRCPSGTFEYTVKAGDTFFTLAQRFNTTVAAIQQANPGVDPNRLQIGQVICIPGTPTPPPPSRCPSGTFEYTVKAGDTFYLLAQRYNTTVAAIQQANPGVDPNRLQIGQVICIPGTPTPPPSGKCPSGTFEYT